MKKILHGIEINEMVEGYLTCALFTNEPDDLVTSGEFCEKENWNMKMFDKEAVEKAIFDCNSFLEKISTLEMLGTENHRLLSKLSKFKLGTLFWYSRNNRGVGFFDCDDIENQKTKDILQGIAESFGQVWVIWYHVGSVNPLYDYENGVPKLPKTTSKIQIH